MLTWTRDLPITPEGPSDVVRMSSAWYQWLQTSENLPKLFIRSDPGYLSADIMRDISHWPNQKIVTVKGLHFLQEDSPVEIGKAIRQFLEEKVP